MLHDPARVAQTAPEPPHNIEAEQALLGEILYAPAQFWTVSDCVSLGDFFDPIHARIYDAIRIMQEAGQTPTAITLRQYFDRDEALAEIGGMEYIARLAAFAVGGTPVRDLARTIHELGARREIMQAAQDASALAADTPIGMGAEVLIDGIEGQLAEIRTHYAIRESETAIAGIMDQSLDATNRAMQGDHGMRVVSHLTDLDRLTGGMRPGQMVVLAGRPSMGKSALAWGLTRGALRDGYGVSFHSLEMTGTELAGRMQADLCWNADNPIAYTDIYEGRLDDAQFRRVYEASEKLKRAPLEIDDRPAQSMPMIRAQARAVQRRMKRNGTDLGLVVIDHLGLIKATDDSPRHLQLGAMSREAKEIAKALEVPVLLLCQLSRAVESRDDKRPQLSDLRQSGEIEENADAVMMIYREAYYESRKEPREPAAWADWDAHMREIANEVEMIVAKNRAGRTGTAKLYCDIAANAFRDAAKHFSEG